MTDGEAYRSAALLDGIGVLAARADGEVSEKSVATRSAAFAREFAGEEAAALLSPDSESDVGGDRARACFRAAKALATGHEDGPTSGARLRSVFSVLESGTGKARYPLRALELDRETLFPRRKYEGGDHAERYAALQAGLHEELPEAPSYGSMVNAMEKYTWSVPASDGPAGVSLFDRARTRAAVADALAGSDRNADALAALADGAERADSSEPLYTLVKGDISGIQAFIHRLRDPDEAQDRIAKRTRGRSVQLWLLNEGLARLFGDRLDLPTTSLLWRGGGQFYALVPPGREAELNAFEQEVNEWLLNRFDGDIFFVQGTATATDSNTSFPALFRRAANATDESKLRKGAGVLGELDSAILSEPQEPCNACGGERVVGEARCVNCRIQEEIGQRLPRTEYIRLDHELRPDADFSIPLEEGGLSWTLQEQADGAAADAVFRLNGTDLPKTPTGVTSGFLFTGAEVPAGGEVDRVWSFAELQQLGKGSADLMHVTKLDIDSLGEAIGSGMAGGPARLAALSRGLEVFFSGYVNRLAEARSFYYGADACENCREILESGRSRTIDHTPYDSGVLAATYYRVDPDEAAELHEHCVERIPSTYIAFSGGDDMLFVGPWDEAVEFAQSARSAFAEYAGGTLSLSGGFYLTRPKYPIGRAAEHAEERLELAKSFVHDDQAKNAAHLFGETRGWSLDDQYGMSDLLMFGRRLGALVEAEEVPSSTLHAFLDIEDDLYPDATGVSTGGKPKEWKIKYLIVRNFEGDLLAELEEKVPAAMPGIGVPISWASLATR